MITVEEVTPTYGNFTAVKDERVVAALSMDRGRMSR
jgi:hypothetical protein